MAKKEEKPEQAAQGAQQPGGGAEQPAPQQNPQQQQQQRQPQRIQLEIDDSKVVATYANFCRVTGTPEELIIDFGLNPQPVGVPTKPIPVTQRIITNFFTAKRMLHALQLTVQRHEATFGVLETDVQRRVRPGAMPAAPPPPQPPQQEERK
ncbi:MAG TPA: DUF3467 domain-containing protein [Planctomycetaceae bacterium]|nr:DUF3467 domain-containing protein [Planctomycetaceae bacterium]